MSYGFDQSTQSDSAQLQAGFHPNFQLTKVSYEGAKKDGTGTMCLTFKFKNDLGQEFIHREFPVNEDFARQYPKENETEDEAISRAYSTQASFIKHIVSKFLGSEAKIANTSSWEAYCNAIIDLLGTSYEGKDLWLKLTYTKKGFVTFPKYPNFIELMSEDNAEKPLKLAITKWDRMTPPEQVAATAESGSEPAGDEHEWD